jgi:hypothetical protein
VYLEAGALPLDFVHHKFHTDCSGIKPGKPEPTVNANVYQNFQIKTKFKGRKLRLDVNWCKRCSGSSAVPK